MSRSGKEDYEVFITLAVCSALRGAYAQENADRRCLCRRKQHKKRLPLQSRHMGNTTLGVTAPPYDEIAQEAFSVWELFEGKYR